MAVDPVTAKLLAQVAAKAATDEQARKRLLTTIFSLVLFLLLLIAFILHLITSPLSLFAQWVMGDQLTMIEDFQMNYGYNQSLGIYEQDYIEGSGGNYEGVVFNDGEIEVVYYSQLDERWRDQPYGTDPIAGYGCGPTSMAIVVSTLAGETVDPPHMAKWASSNGYWCAGNGSYHTLIPGAAKNWGLSCQGNLTAQDIVDALSSGKLVVALMGKGHFTKGGHFIVLRGVTGSGKILVADPASVKRSNQEWDLSLIMNEGKAGAGAGGPFWAIGE